MKLTKVEKQQIVQGAGAIGLIASILIALKLWPRQKKTPSIAGDPIIQTWKSLDL